MWGLERLWPEALLWGLGVPLVLSAVGRVRGGSFLVGAYGLALFLEAGKGSLLLENTWWSGRLGLMFALITLLSWVRRPPGREAGIALLFQLGAYGLLMRSTHLALTWALLETAALAGYFVALSLSTEKNPWAVALTYFIWNVMASALIFMGIALRLAAGKGLSYPLASAGWLSDNLIGWGWAVKVGFLPWQGWLLRLYRAIPAEWAGWFSAVPKGALLSNLLFMLPDAGGEGFEPAVFLALAAATLTGSYSLAWTQKAPLSIVFWGSLGQGAFTALVLVPGAQVAGWYFWMVYAMGTWLGFVYAAYPWGGGWGRAAGLLILANLAALPPVVGFWVKVALFERGFELLSGGWRYLLLGSGVFALGGGLLSYGKALWVLWGAQAPTGSPSLFMRLIYLMGAGGLLLSGVGIGLW